MTDTTNTTTAAAAMKIDVEGLRALRAATGAGIMDCRRALAESSGDAAAAELLLKTWGRAQAEKRADRPASEGCVFIHAGGATASMVLLSCETDFVARNDLFVRAGNRIAALAYAGGATFHASGPEITGEIAAEVAELARVMKERIAIGAIAAVEAPPGSLIETYLHNDARTGVILRAEIAPAAQPKPAAPPAARPAAPTPAVTTLLHDLALHIAAFAPRFVARENVPPAYIAEKKAEFEEAMRADESLRGKPEAMLRGILEGKLRKHLASICLMEQGFLRDEKKTVAAALCDFASRAGGGAEIRVAEFHRHAVGAAE